MDDQQQQFIEQMGLMLESYGRFTRTAGRMLGYFLLVGDVHSLDEVADDLDVSRGSISTNGQKLCQLGVLRQHPEPGDRRMYYRLTETPWESIFQVARERMEQMVETLEYGASIVTDEQEDARTRLEDWQEFYHFMLEDLERKVDRWRERHGSDESVSEASRPG